MKNRLMVIPGAVVKTETGAVMPHYGEGLLDFH